MRSCQLCGTKPVHSKYARYCRGCADRRLKERRDAANKREKSKHPVPRLSARLRRQRKSRTCLRCGKDFMSDGPGNRICGLCNQRYEYREAARQRAQTPSPRLSNRKRSEV